MTRKHGASEGVRARKGEQKSTGPSPFEFKYTKPKHQLVNDASLEVLGQKRRQAAGRPGASRGAAQEGRRAELLPELRRFGKANKLVDKRLGERNAALSKEERLTQRLAWAKRKELKKARKFGLDGEEEELTHFGQSIANVQKYERPLGSDDEDDVRGISSEYVAAAHFGGGDASGHDANGKPLSRNELIAAAVAKSRLAKGERQRERESGLEATDALDEQLATLRGGAALGALMGKAPEPTQVPKDRGYDTLFRSLGMETRGGGVAAMRLPTPEEAAKKEKERLEKLELEREARMLGEDPIAATQKPSILRGTATGVTVVLAKGTYVSADDDAPRAVAVADKEPFEATPFEVCYKEDGTANFSMDDMRSKEKPTLKRKNVAFAEDLQSQPRAKSGKLQCEAKKPSLAIPKEFEAFKELVETRAASELGALLKELVTANHPSLQPGNKDKLKGLFTLCLRFFEAGASDFSAESQGRLSALMLHMHEFTTKDPHYAASRFQSLLRSHRFGLATLPLLRLLRRLFPASDFAHPVLTPALLLAHSALGAARGPRAQARQLLLAAELLPFFAQSKRLSPEIAALLLRVLARKKVTGAVGPLRPPELWGPDAAAPTTAAILGVALELTEKAMNLWEHLASYPEMAAWFAKALARFGALPAPLGEKVKALSAQIATSLQGHRRAPLRIEAVPTLQSDFEFLEPRLETNFNPDAAKKPKTERQRLRKELRKETRGTIRELRRDSAFIAAETQRSAAAADAARKAKTKELMSSLMGQEAEYKQFQRTKNFKRK